MVNNIEDGGRWLKICSHISNNVMENVNRELLKVIYFEYKNEEDVKIYPNEDDVKILNNYFKNNKDTLLHNIENWWIPLLPELEKFGFLKYNEEAINLMKHNKVKEFTCIYGPDKKADLSKLLMFKNTLEKLSLQGDYKYLEMTLNEMKQLKDLVLTSTKVDFKLFSEDLMIEYLFHYGSKTKALEEITRFKKLKRLNIKKNNILENIDFINELNSLEVLELWYCPKKKIPNLMNLKKLKEVSFCECNRLENIDELKTLTNVKVKAWGKLLNGIYENNNDVRRHFA